jgi:superfamily II DNA or RNA helicase
MAVLRFDRGTLLLEGFSGLPPPPFEFDPRVEAYRAPAISYPGVIRALRGRIRENRAPAYGKLELEFTPPHALYPHQQAALAAWKRAGGRGLVVLPTGAGKSLIGLSAIAWASRSALVVVPTLDLMHQWYAQLRAAFPQAGVGLIGGGYHEVMDLAVATYDSAAIHAEKLGNRYGTLVFDEAHHLPTDFYRPIALFSLAPYRLGLTATPERADLRHEELLHLVGPLVYRREAVELRGDVLAEYRIERIYVELSLAERKAYHQALEERNRFLDAHGLSLGTLQGWQRFVMVSARSEAGRRAMRAHREAARIASATPGKLRALEVILARHATEKILIFTADNDTAYAISRAYLIPCLTHQTRVKERQEFLERFREGAYRAIVTSKVLNEGVDVPDASVGVVLSGSSVPRELVQRLGRILRRSQGKRAVLYEIIARETREERVSERRREGVRLDTGGSASRLDAGGSGPRLEALPEQPILWDDLGEE